jgi:MFS family permease
MYKPVRISEGIPANLFDKIAYIIFEVPSNLLLKRFTPRIWQSRIFLSWGIVLACHAACKNKEGMYTARFFLGMMEAGFFPGVVAQLSAWYRSDEMGKPIMWYVALVPHFLAILGR